MDAQASRRKRLNELLETSKGKTYFVLFVTFLFLAAMVVLGILPSYSAFAKQAELNGLRAQYITDLQSKLSVLEGLVVEDQAKAAVKGTFNVIMPNDFNQVDYIFEANQTALKHGMKLIDIKFEITKDFGPKIAALGTDANLRAVSLNIQLEGDKDSVAEYISDMESSIRLYNINDVIMTKKNSDELSADRTRPYKYTILAQTYFFTTAIDE